MLSNPLQRFSPYQNIPQSGLMSNGHVQHSPIHHNSLEPLGHASQYGIHQLHQNMGVQNPQLARASPNSKQRHQQTFGAGGRSSGGSGQVRRRISRACDQCNQLRTKCDGQHPCAHCIGKVEWLLTALFRFLTEDHLQSDFALACEYARERKKRGKASRKDLAARAAAEATGESKSDGSVENNVEPRPSTPSAAAKQLSQISQQGSRKSIDHHVDASTVHNESSDTMSNLGGIGHRAQPSEHHDMDRDNLEQNSNLDLNGFTNMSQGFDRQEIGAHLMTGRPYGHTPTAMSAYPDIPYPMQGQSPPGYGDSSGFRMANGSMTGYPLGAGATSPGWGLAFPSPTNQFGSHVSQPNFNHAGVRYPVLEPLLPHLGSIIPTGLACDLLDLYFSSSSSAQMHPMSPYVLGFVFRKRAFLHPTKPRHCQPALLASMLWVAAQTSDASFLTSVPSARSKTCQKLLELTVSLLNPLIHTPSGHASPAASPAADGVALGGLGVALPGTISMDALTGESGAFGAAGNLDDVITYIHLATVVSASEYKGASLRWWNAAWSLARELKLGRELPSGGPPLNTDSNEGASEGLDEHDFHRNNTDFVTEEEREERRRIWWLVYIVDRHLALCYNRPLFLLDVECDGLKQPLDDLAWQRGEFDVYDTASTDPSVLGSLEEGMSHDTRSRGPTFECRGHSIFGYFLPLMTILGEIVDLHHARNHPRFGVSFRSAGEWDDQAAEITRHLEVYEQSLKTFEKQHLPKPVEEKSEGAGENSGEHHGTGAEAGTPSVYSVHTSSSSRMTESDIQSRIVIAYGTHVMHVLHILLAGKWDPINLIDDEDLWISSQGFIAATSHAVSAAEAISQILEFDPGLEFMPFFFGIYLLQGSFLLLLIADKLQVEASPSVVRACETIVRAHEACVVTLSTEYQVSQSTPFLSLHTIFCQLTNTNGFIAQL